MNNLKNITKKKLNFSVLFGLLMLASLLQPAFSQTRKITGTVLDELHSPLTGATVQLEGTTQGTSTDGKGNFTFQAVDPKVNSLIISFLGYEKLKVPIKGKSSFTIIMKPSSELIEEVVVVGYGTMSRRDLTGAVSSVSGEVISQIPVSNVAQALTGRLAGVNITTNDGALDSDLMIRVRGGGSITQDNSPLYIVDGFPVDNIGESSSADIESIDVLKDASSTAIYGARGANGVIIVTTKSAKAGKTSVSYNGYAQFKKVTRTLDMLSPYEFVLQQHELASIKGGEDLSSFLRAFGKPYDYDIYRNLSGTNYHDEMFGRTAWGQTHNLSINGGTDHTKFNISLTHLNEKGVMLESALKRTNITFKLNHTFNKKLKASLSVYYMSSRINGAGTSANTSTEVRNSINYRPIIGKGSLNNELTDDDMSIYDEIETASGLYDPLTLVRQDYKLKSKTNLNVNTAITWAFIKNFELRSELGVKMNNEEAKRFYGPLTGTARAAGALPVAEINQYNRPSWRTTHTITYKKRKGKHSINAVAGFEAMSEQYKQLKSTSRNLPVNIDKEDAFARMALGSQEYTETKYAPDNRLASFFGRANYTFNNKYLFSATVRADGSTKFAPGNQWGIFPSAAVAWRLSEEEFIKNINFFDNLKLRLSYGEAGNNRIDDDLFRKRYEGTVKSLTMYAGMNNTANVYYAFPTTLLINKDLKWETTITRNIGIDFALLNNRINGTIDAYWNTTKDLLIQTPIPPYSGYREQIRNIGQTSNRGLEITLNGTILKNKDYSLSASFNISFNRNKVDKLDGADSKYYRSYWLATDLRETNDYLLQVGQSVGLMYGYVTDGFYTVDDFQEGEGNWKLKPGVVNSQGVTRSLGGSGGNPLVGSLKLKKLTPVDPNNPDSYNVTIDDRTVIGDANPIHTGGFSLSGNYKNIDLSVFFNWSYGNDVYNAQKIMNTTTWKYKYYNMSTLVDSQHRFSIYNAEGNDLRTDKEAMKAYNANASIWNPAMQSCVFHSWAVEDGSFLRLSNITLGYSLPTKWIKKAHISKARFYVTANNLHVWTKYSGFDPEVNTRRTTPLTPGVDYSAYPKARSFTFGTNITF